MDDQLQELVDFRLELMLGHVWILRQSSRRNVRRIFTDKSNGKKGTG
jgi:hypothetical protein